MPIFNLRVSVVLKQSNEGTAIHHALRYVVAWITSPAWEPALVNCLFPRTHPFPNPDFPTKATTRAHPNPIFARSEWPEAYWKRLPRSVFFSLGADEDTVEILVKKNWKLIQLSITNLIQKETWEKWKLSEKWKDLVDRTNSHDIHNNTKDGQVVRENPESDDT